MPSLLLALLSACLPAAFAGAGKLALETSKDMAWSAREQVKPESLATLAIAGAAAGLIHNSDRSISDTLHSRAALGDGACAAGSVLGSVAFLIPVSAASYGVGRWTGRDGVAETGLMAFEALAVSGLEIEAIKLAVGRRRPDGSDRQSFPSGHAAAGFTLAALAGSEYGWKAGVPATLLASAIAYTRLERHRHYPSDVIFGAGLGISAGRAVHRSHRTRHPERFAFVPFAMPGGLGLLVRF